jgi:HSP20 family protein
MPAVNVNESDSKFEIEVAAPGLTKKDFNITVDNGVLTISSEREEEKEDKKKDYTRREFSYSAFSRSFTMPENVNQEDIKASYEDGILRLHVAKKDLEKIKSRKAIEVK